MKKLFTLLVLFISFLVTTNQASAQDVYWREGFDAGTTEMPSSSSDPKIIAGYFANLPTGSWYFYGTYRTTGTACSGYGAGHLRTLSTSQGLTVDSGKLVTPVLDFGVTEIHFARCRSNRAYGFYYRTDTNSASLSGWNLITTVPRSPNTSSDTAILASLPTAKRIMITGVRDAALSNSNQDFDSIWVVSSTAITPVKFGSINALNTNGVTKLSWTSELETNSDLYAIERSADGITYTQVGVLNATGANKYVWLDNAPLNSTAFYRVKAIDKAGKTNYSTIVKTGAIFKAQELIVAPNPVKAGQLNLQMNNFTKGQYTVNIYNNASQKIFTKTLANDGGTSSQTIQLPAAVKSGVYNLQLLGDVVRLTKRLVVE